MKEIQRLKGQTGEEIIKMNNIRLDSLIECLLSLCLSSLSM